MSARFDLSQPLHFDVGPGEPASSELLLAYTTLLFFAAGLVEADPRDLTLGSLVRHLQGQGGPYHPMRRHNDARPGVPQLAHPPACGCAICATRRRRVTA